MPIVKGLTRHELIEAHCKANNLWAVFINDNDFNQEDDPKATDSSRWHEELAVRFSPEVMHNIFYMTVEGRAIFFDDKSEAENLFRLMDKRWALIYTCLFGPEGAITEST